MSGSNRQSRRKWCSQEGKEACAGGGLAAPGGTAGAHEPCCRCMWGVQTAGRRAGRMEWRQASAPFPCPSHATLVDTASPLPLVSPPELMTRLAQGLAL